MVDVRLKNFTYQLRNFPAVQINGRLSIERISGNGYLFCFLGHSDFDSLEQNYRLLESSSNALISLH